MRIPCLGTAVLTAALGCGGALAQAPAAPADPNSAPPADTAPMPAGVAPVPLEWTPPALAQLGAHALAKTSFTFNRSMLEAAAGLMGDSDAGTKAAIAKLTGVSVHVLRFTGSAPADPGLVEAIRDGYRLPGWKHVVSASDRRRRPGARCQDRCVGGDGRGESARRGGDGGGPKCTDAGHSRRQSEPRGSAPSARPLRHSDASTEAR